VPDERKGITKNNPWSIYKELQTPTSTEIRRRKTKMDAIDHIDRALGQIKLDLQFDDKTRWQAVALLMDTRRLLTRPQFIFTLDSHGVFRIGLPNAPLTIHAEYTPKGVALLRQAIACASRPLPFPSGMSRNAVAKQIGRARDWIVEREPILEELLDQVKVRKVSIIYMQNEKLNYPINT
jgi:hypothetical protein